MVEKVATTWLQCVMPRPDWDGLNARREKLGLKWSQILPPAAESYLTDVERGKIKVERPEKAKPAEKPAKAAGRAAKASKKATAAPATKRVKKAAPRLLTAEFSTPPPNETTIAEDMTELAEIK